MVILSRQGPVLGSLFGQSLSRGFITSNYTYTCHTTFSKSSSCCSLGKFPLSHKVPLNRLTSTTGGNHRDQLFVCKNKNLVKPPGSKYFARLAENLENFGIMSTVSKELPNVVFVLGGPGAGKGTQCSKIVETFGFVHLSAGDLLREERNKEGSQYGEMIEKHIRDGTIVPVEVTCSLIERAMNESSSSFFLIDGFPRNQNNFDGWEKQMSDKVNVLFVLFFDAPEEVCVERCLSRGQAGSGRSDDNPESLKKRVHTYVNDTMPIVNHFDDRKLVRKINAAANPDEVFDEVKALFNGVLGRA